MKSIIIALCMSASLFGNFVQAQEAIRVERPPQYVLLGFDGSLNLDMWDETLRFAHDNNLKFTYFISGVYFLLKSEKANYVEPTHGVGVSAIGWGGKSKEDIKARVGFVNQAYDSGNEIASHANGHFTGATWSLADWESEFKQFYNLVFNVFNLNKIRMTTNANPYHFTPKEITGFRAPQLGNNPDMYNVLKEYKYTYDTSKTASMNYWPQKINDVWNFPLARIRIAGTGKRTLTMDYNFFYTQSGGKDDSSNYRKYKAEMLNTYMGYFDTNYYGNRAPIHIGHHFSKWNGSAYWDAMREFAREVCTKPEVKCVTYKELENFMESIPAATLAAYKEGRFDKAPQTSLNSLRIASVKPLDINVKMEMSNPQEISANISGKASPDMNIGMKEYVWKADGQIIHRSENATLSLPMAAPFLRNNSKLSVSVLRDGRELLKSSHRVVKTQEMNFEFSDRDLEDNAMGGDMPEAHLGEEE